MPDGWYVQFCISETEAHSCDLYVGVDSNSQEKWMTWNTSMDPIVRVPDKYRHVQEIFVRGVAIPEDNDVVLCLKYNDVAKRHYDFDDSEGHKVSTDREEGECHC